MCFKIEPTRKTQHIFINLRVKRFFFFLLPHFSPLSREKWQALRARHFPVVPAFPPIYTPFATWFDATHAFTKQRSQRNSSRVRPPRRSPPPALPRRRPLPPALLRPTRPLEPPLQ
uniref:Uncharacterized protein n=1 Tax=Cacopsylla melanoneura TaxID=428564 RepID=A0A8D8LVT4_9HEMI